MNCEMNRYHSPVVNLQLEHTRRLSSSSAVQSDCRVSQSGFLEAAYARFAVLASKLHHTFLGSRRLTECAPPGALYAAGYDAQTLCKRYTYSPNSKHPLSGLPTLLRPKGIRRDRVGKMISPAACHDRERENIPSAMEAAGA